MPLGKYGHIITLYFVHLKSLSTCFPMIFEPLCKELKFNDNAMPSGKG